MKSFVFSALLLTVMTACQHSPPETTRDSTQAEEKNPTYHWLELKDLDQVNAMVNRRLATSHKNGDAIEPLQLALRDVLSRPDDDGTIDKVIGPLRSQLEDDNAWQSSLSQLVVEAINVLKNPEGHKPDEQVTKAVFLRNVISELRPAARRGEPFEKQTLEKIRDSQIEITREARGERALRLMQGSESPSELADRVLSQNKK